MTPMGNFVAISRNGFIQTPPNQSATFFDPSFQLTRNSHQSNNTFVQKTNSEGLYDPDA